VRPARRELDSVAAKETTRGANKGSAEGIRLSVIVVVEHDPEPLEGILEEYASPLRALGQDFEFVFICGPAAFAGHEGPEISGPRDEKLKVLEVSQPVNTSTMLKVAVEHCAGDVVVALPSSLRVEPSALPRLVRRLEESEADVIVARRSPRRDSWINRLQSRVCNGLISLLTGADIHDITCRVYALRREVLAEIPLYGNYFRFLPVIAEREGFEVEEEQVGQHARGSGTKIYSPRVYLGWLLDIFGLFFLIRFTQSPLRFFGLVGTWTGLAGGAILFVLFVQRLGGQGIADRPMLLLGALLVTLGVQFIALGLIGEIVVHYQAPRISTYRVARRSESSGNAR